MALRSMTYGVLPAPGHFAAAFDREVPGMRYSIGNDPLVGTVDLSCAELYALVSDCAGIFNGAIDSPADCRSIARVYSEDESFTEEERDAWGSLGSAILETLGFEWI